VAEECNPGCPGCSPARQPVTTFATSKCWLSRGLTVLEYVCSLLSVSENKPWVAVCLPAGQMFEPIYSAIAEVCRDCGMESARVPAAFSEKQQLAKVHATLSAAGIVIADLTAKNPNLFYQAGYAHALGKTVVLLTQHGEDFPFNLSEHSVIVYAGNLSVLTTELGRILRAAGEGKGFLPLPPAAQMDAGQQFEARFGDLLREHGYRHEGTVFMEDENTFVLENQEMDLPLVQALARRSKSLGIRLKLL
jgi:hypothetical protein